MPSSNFYVVYNKPLYIECEVPTNHILREATMTKEEDEFGEELVPVYEVRKEEATFTKGDVKLQRITVTEANLKRNDESGNQSKVPQFREVFERVADINRRVREKENQVLKTPIKPRRSSIPRLRNVNSAEAKNTKGIVDKSMTKENMIESDAGIINQDVKITTVPKDNSDVIVQSETEFDQIDDNIADEKEIRTEEINKLTKSDADIIIKDNKTKTVEDRTNVISEQEAEFDKIYETIADEKEIKEEIDLEEVVPVTNEDSEIVESNFERIVNEYHENKIRPLDLDLGKRKTRIPFRKQKSLHDVLPKRAATAARRSSLKGFKDGEPLAPETNYISSTEIKDNNKNCHTKFDSLLNEDNIQEFDKDLTHKDHNIETIIPDKEKDNNETIKTIDEKATSNNQVEINSAKDVKYEDTEAITLSISSRIAIFERQSSNDVLNKKHANEKQVIDLEVPVVEEIQNVDRVLNIQPKRRMVNENNVGNCIDNVLFSFTKTEDDNLEIEKENDYSDPDNFPKSNEIYEENVRVVATVLKDLDKPVNDVEFEEVQVTNANVDENLKERVGIGENNTAQTETISLVENVKAESITYNPIDSENKELLNPANKNKHTNDFNINTRLNYENDQQITATALTTKHGNYLKTENSANSKNDDSETAKLGKDKNKGKYFKTISVSELQKNFNIFENITLRPTQVNRRKSAAEIDLEEKLKGRVKSIVVKIKSIENLTDEGRLEERMVINERERPRRKSVSEKIALFEAKSAGTRFDDKRTYTFKGLVGYV